MRITVCTVRSGGRAIVAGLLVVASLAAQSKPKIVTVATGGTIAGSAESTTAAGYQSGAVAVDVLINAVPQMKTFADVSGVQVASIGSQDMNDEVWVKLATEVNAILVKPDVAAVAKGVAVVRSTRVGDGIVRRNIEVNDDKECTVVSKELNPAKARVLLKLALTQTSDVTQVPELFDRF